MMGRLFRCLAFGVLLLAGLGCGPTGALEQDPEAAREEIRRLEARLARSPADADLLRRLGALYIRTGQYAEGRDRLARAHTTDPNDPRTLFYLGLAHEYLGDETSALALYQRFADVPRRSPYRRLMQGRFRALTRELARREVQDVLAAERTLGADFASLTDTLETTTVGVFPLRYQGQDDRYAPLGRGLSELMMLDLAQIDRLRVVERVRLQALLDEQALGQTDVVDPTTAPRRGLLLGAGTVVGGTYAVVGDADVQIDVSAFDVVGGQAPPPLSASETLANLIRAEKALVLRLVESLGLELTPQEQARILVIPTENLEAFRAYSLGLLQDDAREFALAAASFEQAAALDPGFSLAQEKAAEAASLAAAGTPEAALDLAAAAEPRPEAGANPLIDARLQNLSNSLDAGLVPGTDHREGLEPDALPPLPPPLPPPDNR